MTRGQIEYIFSDKTGTLELKNVVGSESVLSMVKI